MPVPASRPARSGNQIADRTNDGAEELRVQIPATHAVQATCRPGQLAGRFVDQRVMTVLATHRCGDCDDHPDRGDEEEKSDCCDDDTGHDGLPHFRPAEFFPRILLPATQAPQVVPADLMLVGHNIIADPTICTFCPIYSVLLGD